MLATVNAKYLKTALELIGNKTVETNLEITETGIDMAFSDGVEFLWIILPKNEFISYEFSENIMFGINTKTFSSVIKKLENENLRLEITNSQIKIAIQQENKKKEYNLRVLDAFEDKDKQIGIIKEKLRTNIEETFGELILINPKDIKSMIEDLVLDLDSVTFQIVNNNIIIREEDATKGNNKSQMTLMQAFADKSARYNKKRLTQIIEPISKTFEKVEIRFKDNSPVLIKINDNLKMYYFLAPLIENL